MDTKQYWKNRKEGKRGQGERNEQTFYAKGDDIKYLTREGKEELYPNATGSHMIKKDGRLQMVNRKEARSKSRSHPATKKNYAYQVKKRNFSHAS